jgi:hypothetical protein
MAVRILHCSDSINNYNLCIENEITGFTNKSPKSGDLVYLFVKFRNKTYCSARFILGDETSDKPWPDSERFVLARKVSSTEFCLPFDVTGLKNVAGKNWAIKYLQGAKEIKDDNVNNYLNKIFTLNKVEQNIEINEDTLLQISDQVDYGFSIKYEETLIDKNLVIETEIDYEPSENVHLQKDFIYAITSKELNWDKIIVYKTNSGYEYQRLKCNNFTYVLIDNTYDSVKIGKTNNPDQRLNTLKTANPNLSYLIVFPSELFSEKMLHDKLSDYRKQLEWFHYTNTIREFVNKAIQNHNKILESYELKCKMDEVENQFNFNL